MKAVPGEIYGAMKNAEWAQLEAGKKSSHARRFLEFVGAYVSIGNNRRWAIEKQDVAAEAYKRARFYMEELERVEDAIIAEGRYAGYWP